MNLLLQQEYKKALTRGGIDFKKEPEKLYAFLDIFGMSCQTIR